MISPSQITSPYDQPTDPTLTNSALPVAKAPVAPTPPLGATTQPIGSTQPALPIAGGTVTPTSTGPDAPPVAPEPLATTDPMAFAPSPGSALPSISTAPSLTMPGGSTQPAGTATQPPAANGLPSGFTMGDPNSADWGSSYYNGQKVIGNNGQFWELANGAMGPAYDPATEKAITDQANAAYTGSAGKPGYEYQSALSASNPYTSPEVRALLADPEWQAAQNTGPIYANQFSPTTQAEIKKIPNLNTNLALSGTGPNPYNANAANGLPTGSPGGSGGLAPSGTASGVGTPSSGLGTSMGPGGSPAPGSSGTNPGQGGTLPNSFLPAQSASEAANNGYNLNPTTPQNALTNSTITPGPGTDRYAIAKQQLADFTKGSEPAYQASLRDANRYNFGRGRGVSGIANNSIGDLELQRENAIRSSQDQFLGNALTGSIEDAYRNLGIAQQQQGFQAGQQQTAFGQNYATQQLSDSEKKDAFSQALQQWMAGTSNDPSQTALYLAQIFGGDPSQFYNLLNTMKGQAPAPTSPTTPQIPVPAGAG